LDATPQGVVEIEISQCDVLVVWEFRKELGQLVEGVVKLAGFNAE
jgi:hypothetical protein